MPNKLNKSLLAASFCDELRNSLGDETITRIVELNKTDSYEEACASHDFCDPDQVMADVLELYGHEFDPSLIPVVNEAWSIARNAEFQSKKIPFARRLKLATYKREFAGLYETEFTFVVLEHDDSAALVRPLNFPNRQPIEVPWEHLHVFDEIEV